MCRLYQPLCISLLQKNNSIFDILFTNILLHKSPLPPFPFRVFFLCVFGKPALPFFSLINLIKFYGREENGSNRAVFFFLFFFFRRRWQTWPLSAATNPTTAEGLLQQRPICRPFLDHVTEQKWSPGQPQKYST